MEILTIKDASKLLEVDTKTIYRLVERGELPAFKVGRQWRMRLSDINAWIDDQLRAREVSGPYRLRQSVLIPEQASEPRPAGKAGRGFSDSAFSENADLPIHRWVPWIAGFSATFVSEALDRYLPDSPHPGDVCVLDPFAGVGTTLITALLRGHSSYGFEINPYAAEACELKANIQAIPVDELALCIDQFRRSLDNGVKAGKEPLSISPQGFRTRTPFLSPLVERKVLLVQDFITELTPPLVRKCFRLALASELVGFSNYSYEPSLGTRAAAGKQDVQDAPVISTVVRKLRLMLRDIRSTQQRLRDQDIAAKVRFCCGDFFRLESSVPDSTVDLVVTSPPYLNNYHYIRNSRPQVYWLGFAQSPGDLKEIEQGSFGKFWQTVRAQGPIDLIFPMRPLEDAIQSLRRINVDRGPYGGPGWANYAATYFNDCYRFAQVLARILKPRGKAVVVLGNSILQGVEFKTDTVFGDICQACGLHLEDIELLRKKRTGTSIINSSVRANSAPKKARLYESAVVVTNTRSSA
ncbi:MAG: helix-turn-helix domain-containing protein [Candidatus Brocadiae bacterium]|nr:helix-turn-helix domain-containing protein [Candidatus Brocadiia bacterium]